MFKHTGVGLLIMIAMLGSAWGGTPWVRYEDGCVSVVADNVPVKSILREIARQAGFQLRIAERAGTVTGSWTLDRIPLEAAVAELSRPNSLLIFYRPDASAPAIAALQVLAPAETESTSAPRDPPKQSPDTQARRESMREARRLSRLVTDTGALEARRQAIADLSALDPADAAYGLEAALSVEQATLRREVVETLGRIYGDTPPTALGQVIFGDGDAGVRLAAVEALSGLDGEIARAFLEQAVKDKDKTVRQAAAAALIGR